MTQNFVASGRDLDIDPNQHLVNGGIAQLVERLVRNEKARGSNPLTSSLRYWSFSETDMKRAAGPDAIARSFQKHHVCQSYR